MDGSLFWQKTCMLCILSVMLCALVPHGAAATLSPVGSGAGTPVIANGDSVVINGIATGHPREGLQVWVIGKNYLRVSTIPVERDNSFSFEIRPADTQNMASGQYYVVVQHPMMNGVFDIWYDASTGKVYNRQLVAGSSIYQMSGSGSLQGPDSAQALVSAIGSQNVDDSFTTYSFMVSPPAAFIDPVGDKTVGERFTIGGSTNLAVGDDLLVEVTSSSFGPTTKNAPSEFSGASGVVKVVPGPGGYNRWSFDVDTSGFRPDEYIVKVSGVTIDVTGSTVFLVNEMRIPATTSPSPTPPVTAKGPSGTTPLPPVATTPTPRSSPAVPVLLSALVALAVLVKTAGK